MVLGEIPQLQEIAGKVWKKEDELKQLKSELAALDRKIQLELAPPTPEVTDKENEGQQIMRNNTDHSSHNEQLSQTHCSAIENRGNTLTNRIILNRSEIGTSKLKM